MPTGTPINRQWLYTLSDGTLVMDWGEGQAQDVYTGEFIPFEIGVDSYGVTDQELDMLVRAGQVVSYDTQTVYFTSLPEPPLNTLD